MSNTNTINKPAILVAEETKTKLVDTINAAIQNGLPCYMLEPIIRELFTDISNAKRQELEAVQKQYNDALAKEKKKVNTEPVEKNSAHDVLSGDVE